MVLILCPTLTENSLYGFIKIWRKKAFFFLVDFLKVSCENAGSPMVRSYRKGLLAFYMNYGS